MNKIVLCILFLSQTLIMFANSFLNTEDKTGGGNIYIPDLNFKAYLIGNTAINTNLDTEIQYSEAVSFTGTISVNNQSITDLTGIEAFTKLNSLGCYGNSLTTLNLSANTLLTELNCYNNLLTSLNVSGDTLLSTLNCSNNSLTALTLSTNKSLTTLNCYNNLITSLNIPASPLLATLFCNNNRIVSLDVSACTNLDYLNCSVNLLTGLNVTANTNLTTLECSDNSITPLNLSANTKLILLNCPSNSLSTLDVSANTKLTTIWCSYNSLTGLDISANTLLTNLVCDHNLLTALNVSTNTKLTDLYCSNNSIPSLNTLDNTSLRYFECNDNLLTALDVSANINLVYLKCSNNSIEELNLSSNTSLTSLNCYKNALTTLDIRNGNNTNITSISGLNNSGLSCVSVDNVTYSETNWIDDFDPGVSFSLDCSGIPENDTITNTSFNSGDTLCFGAYQTITVGGDGNLVSFNKDSWINLIAGTSITFLPRVHIYEGSYLRASITNDSSFCESLPRIVEALVETEKSKEETDYQKDLDKTLKIQSLKVFPNPNNGFFNIELTGITNQVEIVIYNLSGSTIYKGKLKTENTSVDLSDIQKGLYFLKALNSFTPLIQKILIK
jgi:Leucine-rich repeat (LRR) protein